MLPFPDSHRRAVQDDLAFVEQCVDAIVDILDGRRDDAVFLRLEDDLDSDSITTIRSRVEAIRTELRRAKEQLGLGEFRESKQRTIERRVVEAASTVGDIRSHRLQRLAELDAEQEDRLNQAIGDLLARLVEVRRGLDT